MPKRASTCAGKPTINVHCRTCMGVGAGVNEWVCAGEAVRGIPLRRERGLQPLGQQVWRSASIAHTRTSTHTHIRTLPRLPTQDGDDRVPKPTCRDVRVVEYKRWRTYVRELGGFATERLFQVGTLAVRYVVSVLGAAVGGGLSRYDVADKGKAKQVDHPSTLRAPYTHKPGPTLPTKHLQRTPTHQDAKQALHSALLEDERPYRSSWFVAAVFDPPTTITGRHNEVWVPPSRKRSGDSNAETDAGGCGNNAGDAEPEVAPA